jgi:cytochrome oxidase Cu insertion factor (SCO1/SenC/PrrC family)
MMWGTQEAQMATRADEVLEDSRGPRPGGRAPSNRVLVVLGVVVLLAAAFAVVSIRIHNQRDASAATVRASGLPTNVPTSIASEMGLAPVPHRVAANFVLTDQHGVSRSMASFRGHSVVLEFMDPHCTDICPIVSQEFVDAYRDLGGLATTVDFVAVNVNQYHATVADMARYSNAHELGRVPTWHFFTGPIAALKGVWRDYGIEVAAPNPNADIIHTSIVYFIDARGRERFVAFPIDDHTKVGTAYLPANQIASWGHGIALVSMGLVR